VLELGCGIGYYTRRLLSRGAAHVVAVDLAPGMVRALPTEHVTGVLGDAGTIDLDRKFTHILSAGLLEFVPEPAKVLRNARRHSEAGARLVVLIPRSNVWGTAYRLYHASHGVGATLFTQDRIYDLAGQAGWEPHETRKVWPFSLVVNARAKP
jgi:SAM-dependent methyltransferase